MKSAQKLTWPKCSVSCFLQCCVNGAYAQYGFPTVGSSAPNYDGYLSFFFCEMFSTDYWIPFELNYWKVFFGPTPLLKKTSAKLSSCRSIHVYPYFLLSTAISFEWCDVRCWLVCRLAGFPIPFPISMPLSAHLWGQSVCASVRVFDDS